MKKLVIGVLLSLAVLSVKAQSLVDRENYVEITPSNGAETVSYPKDRIIIGDDGSYVYGTFGDRDKQNRYIRLFSLDPSNFGYSSESTGVDSLRRYLSDMTFKVYNTQYKYDGTIVDTIYHIIYSDTVNYNVYGNDGSNVTSKTISTQ